jgi:hypothetical protein
VSGCVRMFSWSIHRVETCPGHTHWGHDGAEKTSERSPTKREDISKTVLYCTHLYPDCTCTMTATHCVIGAGNRMMHDWMRDPNLLSASGELRFRLPSGTAPRPHILGCFLRSLKVKHSGKRASNCTRMYTQLVGVISGFGCQWPPKTR